MAPDFNCIKMQTHLQQCEYSASKWTLDWPQNIAALPKQSLLFHLRDNSLWLYFSLQSSLYFGVGFPEPFENPF
jgi:hypothetical protein